ncbi:Sodium/calcium exchanger protein-domain-containing protein [Blastocladiella britannica]|nr:Sodium/calcium exchanger protein-domain-containing protein [Blastocladiella britannica]
MISKRRIVLVLVLVIVVMVTAANATDLRRRDLGHLESLGHPHVPEQPGVSMCSRPPASSSHEGACAHFMAHCAHLCEESILDYARWHYCSLPDLAWAPWAVLALSAWLSLLFLFLGTTASEFFCPNLTTLSTTLGLSESLAGVTLLAFGNGAPDLLSTYSALSGGAGGLAIGELIGAAAFITTLVLGGVAVLSPFVLDPVILFRDAAFFLGALVALVYVIWDGTITTWEAAALIAYYGAYVVVVGWSDWHARHAGPAIVLEDSTESLALAARLYDSEEGEYSEEDDGRPLLGSPRSHTASRPSAPPLHIDTHGPPRILHRPSEISIVEEDHLSDLSSSGPAHLHVKLLHRMRSRLTVADAIHLSDAVDGQSLASPGLAPTAWSVSADGATALPIAHAPFTPFPPGGAGSIRFTLDGRSRSSSPVRSAAPSRTPSRASSATSPRVPLTVLSTLADTKHGLTPLEIHASPTSAGEAAPVALGEVHDHRPSLLPPLSSPTRSGVIILPMLPYERPLLGLLFPVLVSAVTAHGPSVHFTTNALEDESPAPLAKPARLVSRLGNIFKFVALSAMAPMYLVLRLTVPVVSTEEPSSFGAEVRHPVLCAAQNFLGTMFGIFGFARVTGMSDPSLGITVAAGLVATAALYAIDARWPVTRHSSLYSVFGFVVGMLWISMVANEIVAILKTLGLVLGISDSVLGLTVFAAGNSLGDLIANLSMAYRGYPTMAIAACYASPMLNLVLGVGGSVLLLSLSQQLGSMPLNDVGISIKAVSLGLMVIVAVCMWAIPRRRYQVSRAFGAGLVVLYFVLVSLALLFSVVVGSLAV